MRRVNCERLNGCRCISLCLPNERQSGNLRQTSGRSRRYAAQRPTEVSEGTCRTAQSSPDPDSVECTSFVAFKGAAHQPATNQDASHGQQFPQAGVTSEISIVQQQASHALPSSVGAHAASLVSQAPDHDANVQNQTLMVMEARANALPASLYAFIARAAKLYE
ncbi:hypothetical protein FGB62_36g06 [Gracilaria domingensis]|nr:hypothetical protein FGB62_150g010 [Gracilaria domingensis]KAI0563677.1 hypothetical protein FGB62_36g06 [Gracilaria domingensis]